MLRICALTFSRVELIKQNQEEDSDDVGLTTSRAKCGDYGETIAWNRGTTVKKTDVHGVHGPQPSIVRYG